jgi:hypothetical protein
MKLTVLRPKSRDERLKTLMRQGKLSAMREAALAAARAL